MKYLTQGRPSGKMVNVRGKAKGFPAIAQDGQKERCIMAENKGITEVAALRAAIAGELTDEVIEKLNHMIEVRSRKRERKPDDSKRLANIALGEQFAEGFEGENFKASDVAAALGVSVAKASAICKAMGWEKIPTTEKVAVYTL